VAITQPEKFESTQVKAVDRGLRLQSAVRRSPEPILSDVVNRSHADSIANM